MNRHFKYGDSGFLQAELLRDILILPMCKKQGVERLKISESTIGLQSVRGCSDGSQKCRLVHVTLLCISNVPTG
jgi:hypothetical protein